MPVELFGTRLSYRAATRSVVVAAICNGRIIDVVVPSAVLEHLAARTRRRNRESLAAISDNLKPRRAASSAATRSGMYAAVTVIEFT